MFALIPCAAGCGLPAVTGSPTCAVHAASPEAEAERIAAWILERQVIKDLNAQGLCFKGKDFSRRRFYGCNFKETVFMDCVLSEVLMRMVFFDFSSFLNCRLSKGDFQFLSFAGSILTGSAFDGSEILHVNFGGSAIRGCVFDNSNLYNSRFITADLKDTSFRNCNIKQTNFIEAKQEGVVFKSSNTAEAIFEMENTG